MRDAAAPVIRRSRATPAAALAVLALAALWWLRSPAERAAVAPADAIAPYRGPEAPAPAAPAPEPAARVAVPSLASAEEAPARSAPPADPLLGSLEGTVVTEQGAAIAGARVVALRARASDNTLLWQMDPAFRADLERAGETETDERGRFRLVLARGIPFDLEVSAAGRADGFAGLCHVGEEVRVMLGAEREVRGKLARERDGGPIAGARVRVFELGAFAARETESAADGSYRVRHPFTGSVYLEVLPEVEEATQWVFVEPGPDGAAVLDFVLADGVAASGRVTEAGSGRPLAGALVGEGWQLRRTAVTDADGRYRLPGIGGGVCYGLSARASGHGTVKRLELPAAADGAIQVDFELPLAWSATGRVVDRAGAPVAGARVESSGWISAGQGQQMEHSSCRTDADGRFRLDDLTPGARQSGTVSAAGFARLAFALVEPRGRLELALPELVLGPPALVAGRVLDPDGAPVTGADVTLEAEKTARTAVTGASGGFAFGELGPGSYVLHAKRDGRPARPRFHVVLLEGEIRAEHVLKLQRGRAIRGRVLDEQGTGVAGVHVAATQMEPDDPRDALEDALSTWSAADGSFLFTDVPPGEYHLQAFPRRSPAAAPGRTLLDAYVMSIDAGAPPVDVVLRQAELIRGRLLDAAGAPLLNHSVVGYAPNGERTWISATDAAGRFELAVAPGTTWELRVSGPAQGAREEVLATVPGVAAGTLDVELRLPAR